MRTARYLVRMWESVGTTPRPWWGHVLAVPLAFLLTIVCIPLFLVEAIIVTLK